ncbi:MAG: dienelactone hydrolase family protein [Terriglobia bacterium]
MKSKIAGLGVMLASLLLMTGMAQGAVKTETVTYKSGNEPVKGFLALPGTPGKHPGIVVIHEWWGLTPWVKEQAEKFAARGYVALAVDLYRGKSTDDPMVAHELARGLPQDRAIRDLKAGFDYLASRSDVIPQKIGSVGWCMGGGWSLNLAENEPSLAACAVNYGALPTDADNIARIHAPVLGNFGALDRGIPPPAVAAFVKAMKAQGKQVDAKVYPDCGHAFENPNNKKGYRAASAQDAWNRMLAFFQRTLSHAAMQ